MAEQYTGNKAPKRKGFVARFLERLDKKMEEKVQQQPCCAKPKDNQKSSCC